jgi:hypothetical protein
LVKGTKLQLEMSGICSWEVVCLWLFGWFKEV